MRHATTLLFALGLGCASHPESADVEDPDEGSSTAVAASDTHICSAPELADCTADDDIAVCTTAAIKYEYEMLEARQQGNRAAFECHRGTLVSLLDHACGLGDDQACGQGQRTRKVEPPA
jgi:hypothetical protein